MSYSFGFIFFKFGFDLLHFSFARFALCKILKLLKKIYFVYKQNNFFNIYKDYKNYTKINLIKFFFLNALYLYDLSHFFKL